MNYIYFHCGSGGLANRLRALNALRVVAEEEGAGLVVAWTPDMHCPAQYNDLFEPAPDFELLTQPPESLLEDTTIVGKYSPSQRLHGCSHQNEFHQVLLPEMEPKEFASRMQAKARDLPVRRSIQSEVDRFVEEYGLDSRVGLHIRRTDMVTYAQKRECTYDDEQIIEMLLKAGDGVMYFLATDNQDSERVYRQALGARVVVLLKRYDASQHRQTSVRIAVMDLYLLARCQRIIGTELSSYSPYAALLGGVPLQRVR